MGDYSLDSCVGQRNRPSSFDNYISIIIGIISLLSVTLLVNMFHMGITKTTNNNITSRNFETWGTQVQHTLQTIYICTPVDLHEAKVSYLVIP